MRRGLLDSIRHEDDRAPFTKPYSTEDERPATAMVIAPILGLGLWAALLAQLL